MNRCSVLLLVILASLSLVIAPGCANNRLNRLEERRQSLIESRDATSKAFASLTARPSKWGEHPIVDDYSERLSSIDQEIREVEQQIEEERNK